MDPEIPVASPSFELVWREKKLVDCKARYTSTHTALLCLLPPPIPCWSPSVKVAPSVSGLGFWYK